MPISCETEEGEWIDCPIFYGINLKDWIAAIEDFFNKFEIPDVQHVNLAFHHIGVPSLWGSQYAESIPCWSWYEMVEALQAEFGDGKEDKEIFDVPAIEFVESRITDVAEFSMCVDIVENGVSPEASSVLTELSKEVLDLDPNRDEFKSVFAEDIRVFHNGEVILMADAGEFVFPSQDVKPDGLSDFVLAAPLESHAVGEVVPKCRVTEVVLPRLFKPGICWESFKCVLREEIDLSKYMKAISTSWEARISHQINSNAVLACALVQPQGWPPPASIFHCEYYLSSQIISSAARHFNTLVAFIIHCGKILVHYGCWFASFRFTNGDAMGDSNAIYLPWIKVCDGTYGTTSASCLAGTYIQVQQSMVSLFLNKVLVTQKCTYPQYYRYRTYCCRVCFFTSVVTSISGYNSGVVLDSSGNNIGTVMWSLGLCSHQIFSGHLLVLHPTDSKDVHCSASLQIKVHVYIALQDDFLSTALLGDELPIMLGRIKPLMTENIFGTFIIEDKTNVVAVLPPSLRFWNKAQLVYVVLKSEYSSSRMTVGTMSIVKDDHGVIYSFGFDHGINPPTRSCITIKGKVQGATVSILDLTMAIYKLVVKVDCALVACFGFPVPVVHKSSSITIASISDLNCRLSVPKIQNLNFSWEPGPLFLSNPLRNFSPLDFSVKETRGLVYKEVQFVENTFDFCSELWDLRFSGCFLHPDMKRENYLLMVSAPATSGENHMEIGLDDGYRRRNSSLSIMPFEPSKTSYSRGYRIILVSGPLKNISACDKMSHSSQLLAVTVCISLEESDSDSSNRVPVLKHNHTIIEGMNGVNLGYQVGCLGHFWSVCRWDLVLNVAAPRQRHIQVSYLTNMISITEVLQLKGVTILLCYGLLNCLRSDPLPTAAAFLWEIAWSVFTMIKHFPSDSLEFFQWILLHTKIRRLMKYEEFKVKTTSATLWSLSKLPQHIQVAVQIRLDEFSWLWVLSIGPLRFFSSTWAGSCILCYDPGIMGQHKRLSVFINGIVWLSDLAYYFVCPHCHSSTHYYKFPMHWVFCFIINVTVMTTSVEWFKRMAISSGNSIYAGKIWDAEFLGTTICYIPSLFPCIWCYDPGTASVLLTSIFLMSITTNLSIRVVLSQAIKLPFTVTVVPQ